MFDIFRIHINMCYNVKKSAKDTKQEEKMILIKKLRQMIQSNVITFVIHINMCYNVKKSARDTKQEEKMILIKKVQTNDPKQRLHICFIV